jgi:Cu/Ag efflux protein CusF
MKPFLFALMTVLAPAVFADEAHHKKDALALVEGEVRRVDKAAKKITLRHGPMPALDMPAHTMVFQVRDPAMLEQVKPGDKVKFEAQKIGGAFTLIQIEVAQ